jgi:hypothetical protein
VMLNIRGMSIVKNFLTGVNRFGQGLTMNRWQILWDVHWNVHCEKFP